MKLWRYEWLFFAWFGLTNPTWPLHAVEPPSAIDLPSQNDLPDPFAFHDGSRVRSKPDWERRREEIRETLLHYEYGHPPSGPSPLLIQEGSREVCFQGKAELRRVSLFLGPNREIEVHAALYVPLGRKPPFPVLIANDLVWLDHLRPITERIVERGYVFAGFDRHNLDRDDADRSDGVHPLYPGSDWATLAVWAWGCMRVVDYLFTLEEVDKNRIALTGHSRAGKTALLAGALDERIALVNPNGSGAGGAGSYRIRGEGCETLELITRPDRFRYWFHPRLREFANQEDRLPFDQHLLLALIAPRALLVTEAREDHWANPLGTQQMVMAAKPVFKFLGVPEKIGLHFREGGHDQLEEDYDALLDFADLQFFGEPTDRAFDRLPFPNAEKAFSWDAPSY